MIMRDLIMQRKSMNLTQEELGKIMNVSNQQVSRWERLGIQDLEPFYVPRYAEALCIEKEVILKAIEASKQGRADDMGNGQNNTIEGAELQRLVARWFCNTAGKVNGNATATAESITESLLKMGQHVRQASVKSAIGSLRDSKRITIVRDGLGSGSSSIFKILDTGWRFAHNEPAGNGYQEESPKEAAPEPQLTSPTKADVPVVTPPTADVPVTSEEVQETETEKAQGLFESNLMQLMSDARRGRELIQQVEQFPKEQAKTREELELVQFENLNLAEQLQSLQNKDRITEEQMRGLAAAMDILNHLHLVAQMNGTEFGMVKLVMGNVFAKDQETEVIALAANTLTALVEQYAGN